MPLRRSSQSVREAAPSSGCRVTKHQGGNDVNGTFFPNSGPATVFLDLSYCTLNRCRPEDDGPAVHPFGGRILYRETDPGVWTAERWIPPTSNDDSNRHICPNTRAGTGPIAASSLEMEAQTTQEEDASHG